MDLELVGTRRASACFGDGCQQSLRSFYGISNQCRVSRVRSSGGLDHCASRRTGSLGPKWIALFDCLVGSVPANWTGIVLADRGLYARWLYQHVQSLSWHPFLRINLGGKARPKGTDTYHWLATFAPVQGYSWSGQVRCFTAASSRLDCTLLARWDEDYKDPL